MLNNNIIPKSALPFLGITEQEASVYEAGIAMGPSSASALATATHIDRVQTYSVLTALEKKGYLSRSGAERKTLFTMEPPRRLVQVAQRKKQDILQLEKELQSAVRELEQQAGEHDAQSTTVRSYRGAENVKKIASEIVQQTPQEGTIHSLASLKSSLDTVSHTFLADWFTSLNEKNISSKSVWSNLHTAPEFERELRDLRIAPQEIDVTATMMIYENTVVFFTAPPNVQTVIIENADVASTLRSVQEYVWQKSHKT